MNWRSSRARGCLSAACIYCNCRPVRLGPRVGMLVADSLPAGGPPLWSDLESQLELSIARHNLNVKCTVHENSAVLTNLKTTVRLVLLFDSTDASVPAYNTLHDTARDQSNMA